MPAHNDTHQHGTGAPSSSLLDQYLRQRVQQLDDGRHNTGVPKKHAPHPSPRAPAVPTHPGKRPPHLSVRTVGPNRRFAGARLHQAMAPAPSPRGSHAPSEPPRSIARQRHMMEALDGDGTSPEKREADLLSVFRYRRERYDEAVAHAHTILHQMSAATEFVPKEERLKIKPPVDGVVYDDEMTGPVPTYALKPKGRELQVFNDSVWVEDPFLLDDVDAEEQAELSALMKHKESVTKLRMLQHQHALAITSGPRRDDADGDASLDVVAGGGPPDSSSNAGDGVTAEVALEGTAGFLSHPSEVARKRRIIRKLWMGNVIQLRDLYTSKAGGFHNMRGDNVSAEGGSGGAPLPEFQHDVNEEGEEVVEDVDALSTAAARGGGGRKAVYADRDIPPVPTFSSRSLGWIAESICHDMSAVVLGTENILRASMDVHTRRTGTMDSDLQRCAYLARKAMKWCEGAQLHANLFGAGESVVSLGLTSEITTQRKQVLALHEELSGVQKQVDDAAAELEALREEVAAVRRSNAIKMFAVDSQTALDVDDADGGDEPACRDTMLRLRQLLHTASAALRNAGNKPQRLSWASASSTVPSLTELRNLEQAVERISDALIRRGGNAFTSLEAVSRGVMAATKTLRRRPPPSKA